MNMIFLLIHTYKNVNNINDFHLFAIIILIVY